LNITNCLNDHQLNFNHTIHLLNKTLNSSTQNFNHSNDHQKRIDNLQLFFEILEKICEFGSLTILGVFILEIVVKLIFDPKSFLKLLEFLDIIIVTVSFGLDLFLLLNNIQIHAITGLITLLRYIFIYFYFQKINLYIQVFF
jgi:hypothetical protein